VHVGYADVLVIVVLSVVQINTKTVIAVCVHVEICELILMYHGYQEIFDSCEAVNASS